MEANNSSVIVIAILMALIVLCAILSKQHPLLRVQTFTQTAGKVSEFNFVHRLSDYEMLLENGGNGEPAERVLRSFTLQKSKAMSTRPGGSSTTLISDDANGIVYKLTQPEPSLLESANRSEGERVVLSKIGKCSLEEKDIDSSASEAKPERRDFILKDESETTVSYLHEPSQTVIEFSKISGNMMKYGSRKVLEYKEGPIESSEFDLPELCTHFGMQMKDGDSTPSTLKAVKLPIEYEVTRDDVLREIKLSDSSTDALSMYLSGRLAGTKWCGRGNDYNEAAPQMSPKNSETISCPNSNPPTLSGGCNYKVTTSLDPVTKFQAIANIGQTLQPGPYCVANDPSNPMLSALDKACRQHDNCPNGDGYSMQSCACDYTIRKRTSDLVSQYGSSFQTTIVLAVFGADNALWPCVNLERQCTHRNFFGICNEWNKWGWASQYIHKYTPDNCPPSKFGCFTNQDEGGFIWGNIGYYSDSICL